MIHFGKKPVTPTILLTQTCVLSDFCASIHSRLPSINNKVNEIGPLKGQYWHQQYCHLNQDLVNQHLRIMAQKKNSIPVNIALLYQAISL